MAAPSELFCWKGSWGLPSVDTDSLIVLAYARFAGTPLKVHKISNPWRSPTGSLPALKTKEDGSFSQPGKIIIQLRKQKYNADYDLSAKEGADTLAFISLLEEKLMPALLYSDALECMNLLSQRLGSNRFFFGDSPSSLDAYVFGHLAPLLKIILPCNRLQQQLKALDNLPKFCSNILSLYFPDENREGIGQPASKMPEGSDNDHEPYKRHKQLLSVLVAVAAMLGYALLTGIVAIEHVKEERTTGNSSIELQDEEDA
ncbi:metaxin-1a isoform X2 [Tachysurus fulvidraco]|uniref:metaxin-1a isoform X2 n=1 Tax=Tachysurus fulvidraco TaxID=1234273 RepID=UPI000F50F3D1|nr:metaxin-1a isoform X2 [Tachysurus fulvidraco]